MKKQEISRLEEINVDPFTAWQATKKILAGLSHHHSNTKDIPNSRKSIDHSPTYLRRTSANPKRFFEKEIFGRNAPYDKQAVEDLLQLETNYSIADPIFLEELKNTLKKAINRKSPGSNCIPIKINKHLDGGNLTKVLNILNLLTSDPTYAIPD